MTEADKTISYTRFLSVRKDHSKLATIYKTLFLQSCTTQFTFGFSLTGKINKSWHLSSTVNFKHCAYKYQRGTIERKILITLEIQKK